MGVAVRQTHSVGIARVVILAALFAVSVCSISQDRQRRSLPSRPDLREEDEIKQLISMYAKAADEADPTLASSVWCDSSDDSLINPVGHWSGVKAILGFYRHEMGDTYSSRNLKITDISIRVYTDAAWAEFNWDFDATRKNDGSAVSFHGVETQIYHKNYEPLVFGSCSLFRAAP